jgi:hypothetical protein
VLLFGTVCGREKALRQFIQAQRLLVILVKAKQASSIIGQLKESRIIVRQ